MKSVCNGTYDTLGGYHEDGLGWNPSGWCCGGCERDSCEGCPNWTKD